MRPALDEEAADLVEDAEEETPILDEEVALDRAALDEVSLPEPWALRERAVSE